MDGPFLPCTLWEVLIIVIGDLVAECVSKEEDGTEEKQLRLTNEPKQLGGELCSKLAWKQPREELKCNGRPGYCRGP
jgi:hypothetical protein